MTYFPMGDGDPIAFNSTKYPGVCKPMNETTLQAVYALQNACNRIAKMQGGKLIARDGDIGPGTLSAARFAAGYLGPSTLTSATSSCTALGAVVVEFAAALNEKADSMGAPAQVAAPVPPKAPTIINTAGIELKAPPPVGASLLDSVKNLGMPTLLVLGAGLVGIGYYVTRKK